MTTKEKVLRAELNERFPDAIYLGKGGKIETHGVRVSYVIGADLHYWHHSNIGFHGLQTDAYYGCTPEEYAQILLKRDFPDAVFLGKGGSFDNQLDEMTFIRLEYYLDTDLDDLGGQSWREPDNGLYGTLDDTFYACAPKTWARIQDLQLKNLYQEIDITEDVQARLDDLEASFNALKEALGCD